MKCMRWMATVLVGGALCAGGLLVGCHDDHHRRFPRRPPPPPPPAKKHVKVPPRAPVNVHIHDD